MPAAVVPADRAVSAYERHDPARVVVEVLSPSTEREDRTDKFRDYQRLSSLRHHVLIEQDRPSVIHYEKLAQGLWAIVGDHTELQSILRISLGDIELSAPLSALYRRVAFSDLSAKSDAD